jgi:hypothetical protein
VLAGCFGDAEVQQLLMLAVRAAGWNDERLRAAASLCEGARAGAPTDARLFSRAENVLNVAATIATSAVRNRRCAVATRRRAP